MSTVSVVSLWPAPGCWCLHCICWNISIEVSTCPSERFGNYFILSLAMKENGGAPHPCNTGFFFFFKSMLTGHFLFNMMVGFCLFVVDQWFCTLAACGSPGEV